MPAMKRNTALATLLAGAIPAAWAQGAAEAWLPAVQEQLNPDAGNPDVVADLLQPAVDPQFSQNWNVARAQQALRDRLAPSKECFLDRRPQGDPDLPVEACTYTRGVPTGEGDAAMMRVNLGSGELKYINRGRNPAPGQAVKLDEEAAQEYVMKTAGMLGIPSAEMARDYVQTNRLQIRGGYPDQGADPLVLDQEVQVTIPRCMPVAGKLISDCVPVFNSGLRTTVVDGPVMSWMKSTWTDFHLSRLIGPALDRREVELRTAQALARDMTPGTASRLMSFISYAQVQDIGNGEAGTTCAPGNTKEDEQAADTALGREYLPAVVVYAVPHDPGELKDENDPPPQSTGGYQFTIPLVALDGCDKPQAG